MKNPISKLPLDVQAHWRSLLTNNDIVKMVVVAVKERRPHAYKIKDANQTVESVALQGAFSEGYAHAIDMLYSIAFEGAEHQESQFLDTDVD